ncbi:hypothetical protein EAF04_006594 [Stromatinia cepivora]|nr:hypothetical protein EAF04_006594 [Stromatinia cepivora]
MLALIMLSPFLLLALLLAYPTFPLLESSPHPHIHTDAKLMGLDGCATCTPKSGRLTGPSRAPTPSTPVDILAIFALSRL